MNEIFFFHSHERKRERETATDSDRVRENRVERTVFRQRVKSQGSRSFIETT